jgi:hypothetical protein
LDTLALAASLPVGVEVPEFVVEAGFDEGRTVMLSDLISSYQAGQEYIRNLQ